jgi:hypothetical protein
MKNGDGFLTWVGGLWVDGVLLLKTHPEMLVLSSAVSPYEAAVAVIGFHPWPGILSTSVIHGSFSSKEAE